MTFIFYNIRKNNKYVIQISEMQIQELLEQQRKNLKFHPSELSEVIYGKEDYHQLKRCLDTLPPIDYDPNIFNKDRIEFIKEAYKNLPFYYKQNSSIDTKPENKLVYNILSNHHQNPGSAHVGMFIRFIELMGTEKHIEQYLQKSKRYQIVGCYAQTELGTGSDVKNLETTATYVPQTKQFIINSPNLTSAKYWPGEISFLANYAIVFAQCFIKGQKYGVFPFLVKIKDQNYQWLQGIEGGDIGPKIGYHAKQNGYMLFHSVRIPKDNLFTKYISISDEGDLSIVGDPKVGYGTMMYIREIISCDIPKSYSQAIIIALRYSLFRKQFKDDKQKEIPILNYQTQQEKIFPRIAEYYAIIIAGNKIRKISKQNTERVMKSDFSLMKEAHNNLSFSKAYFSQTIYFGMEMCRRSMGGHGVSVYSGLPSLIVENSPHNTHEGQNTVMYLQVSKQIFKSWKRAKKGKKVIESIEYVSRSDALLKTKRNMNWGIEEIKLVLLQGICFLVGKVSTKVQQKKDIPEKEVLDYFCGIEMQKIAVIHSIYTTFSSFADSLSESSSSIKPALIDLCMLFGIDQLINRVAQTAVAGGFVTNSQLKTLDSQREVIFGRMRTIAVGLVDGFGIPEKYIRSQVAKGDPYQNMLDKARQCDLNHQINDFAKITSQLPEHFAKL